MAKLLKQPRRLKPEWVHVMTCVHEAGHAVDILHDLKRDMVITKIKVLTYCSAFVAWRRSRHPGACQGTDHIWNDCALNLAGVAAVSLFFDTEAVLAGNRSDWRYATDEEDSDWERAMQNASFLEALGVKDARRLRCPWPTSELAPNDGCRLLRKLCGPERFALLSREQRMIIGLAWRRALWVLRRRRKAVVRLTHELLEKGELGGKRAARIFNEIR